MNRKAKLAVSAFAVATGSMIAVTAGETAAHAQNVVPPAVGTATTQRGFAINRFNISERGSEWFALDSLDFRGNLRFAIGVTGEAAFKPIAIPQPEGHATVVSDQFYVHLSASLIIADTVRIGIDSPFLLQQTGHDANIGLTHYSHPSKVQLGDGRVSLDVRLLNNYGDKFTLVAGAQLFNPAGARSQYSGDDESRGVFHLIGAGDIGNFTYSASLGIMLRNGNYQFADQVIGDEAQWGAAVGLRLANRKLLIGPEFYGSTIISSPHFFAYKETPMELLGSVHYMPADDWRIGAGAGPGLSPAYGTPDVRVLASIEWAPHYVPPPPPVGDRDGDKIKDDVDACPDTPGVKTEDPKTNGCPLADQDGDGVPDTIDACPKDPGVKTDDPKTNGCPGDKDGDRIPDNTDACPDVPGIATNDPKTNGCPADKDADGIPDDVDACPDVPGVKSDDPKKNGCPVAGDKDGDGIPDDVDACPNDAGPKNDDPKKNGCPMARVENGQVVITEQVHFKVGSAVILADSDVLLGEVAKVLTSHKEITKVRVEGHTDNTGSAATNRKLSKERAASVAKWLGAHGIDKARLDSEGFGPDRPIAPNSTAEGKAANRRVEFHIEGGGDGAAATSPATSSADESTATTKPAGKASPNKKRRP